MTAEQARKIIRSKLKKDCIYYSVEGHTIRCCMSEGEPTCFTKIDQCVACKKYRGKNNVRL